MDALKNAVLIFSFAFALNNANAIDLGVPGLGGDKKEAAGKEDPDALNTDIKQLLELANFAMYKFLDALGDKEGAEAAKQNSECIKTDKCSVKDNIETLTKVSDSAKKAAEEKKAAGEKLDKDAGKTAMAGMIPGFQSIMKWPVIKDRVTAYKDQVGVSGMLRAPKAIKGLVKALPKLPGAIKTQVSAAQTAANFLSYSGVDTKKMEEKMKNPFKKA